jgi:hypothetical protein
MKNILFLFLFLTTAQCDKFYEDDVLSIKRVPYNGDELRIDGYYYEKSYKDDIYNVYFFYHNGVLLAVGGVENSLEAMDSCIRRFYYGRKDYDYSKVRYKWGVYTIKNDSIAFERWYPSERPHWAYVREGVILNDTTFHITNSYRVLNGEKTEIEAMDETFHFRQFSPKPDSSNIFIHY